MRQFRRHSIWTVGCSQNAGESKVFCLPSTVKEDYSHTHKGLYAPLERNVFDYYITRCTQAQSKPCAHKVHTQVWSKTEKTKLEA